MAIRTAALQQEMMVAALVCSEISAYNNFVLSHQAALQASDKTLLSFFQQANAQSGFSEYNFYKTELANASSLRSIRDPYFCSRIRADFNASMGRPLEQVLSAIPYQVDTGSVRCESVVTTASSVTNTQAPPAKPVRHRTWLGRLIDVFD